MAVDPKADTLPYPEYEKLSFEQKIAYLQKAFRQSQEPGRPVTEETAQQSAAAESKI